MNPPYDKESPTEADTPTMRRRYSDLPWPERAGRAVARFFSAVSTKEGLGAAFALVLLGMFVYSNRQDREDRRAERRALAEERQRNQDAQQKAFEGIANALNRQADVLSDQKAALSAIEALMRVQTQADLKEKQAVQPPPPPRSVVLRRR